MLPCKWKDEVSSCCVLPCPHTHLDSKAECGALPLRFEFLHNIQEVIVDLRLATKLQLHLVKVRQCILHLETEQTGYISRDFISPPLFWKTRTWRYSCQHWARAGNSGAKDHEPGWCITSPISIGDARSLFPAHKTKLYQKERKKRKKKKETKISRISQEKYTPDLPSHHNWSNC